MPGGWWQVMQALEGSPAAFSSGVPGPPRWRIVATDTWGLTVALALEWQAVHSVLTLPPIPGVFSFKGWCELWHVAQLPAAVSEIPVKSVFAARANLLAYFESVEPSRFIVPGVQPPEAGAPGLPGSTPA